jgi:Cu-Zn family superoxide dismutase
MMTKSSIVAVLAFLLGASGSALAEGPTRATAELVACDGSGRVVGVADFKENKSSERVRTVDVHLHVFDLGQDQNGKRAVHVHETGDCSSCGAANGHFDPGPYGNTTPVDGPEGNHPFHSGDLINVDVKKGAGSMETTSSRFTLSAGRLSLFDDDGSALIVHKGPDTYCPDGKNTLGCAGGMRAACGVIEPLD